jgi:glycerol-3-phosphate cytidylyltransferase
MKYKLGYTAGVFDLFHIGHLNLLRRAKEQCEYLIAAVSVDKLVAYKNKRAVIPFNERIQIVESIKYVDRAVPQENMDKLSAWEKYQFDVMFVGDDWKGTEKWNTIEASLGAHGVSVVYFPYTEGTSSTLINEILIKMRYPPPPPNDYEVLIYVFLISLLMYRRVTP